MVIGELSTYTGLTLALATVLAVIGVVATAYYIVRSKAREVAETTALTWKANAEAERAERGRLQEQVTALSEELVVIRRQAPELSQIAKGLELLGDLRETQTTIMARMDQSLELVVRELGEYRQDYRGPVELDPLTVDDPEAHRAQRHPRRPRKG